MTKTDDGHPRVREVGLLGEDAQGWQTLTSTLVEGINARPAADGVSALQAFGGPAQAAEIVNTAARIQAKPEGQRHPTEQAFLDQHRAEMAQVREEQADDLKAAAEKLLKAK